MILAVGIASSVTKVLTGYWAAGRAGVDPRGRIRAGMALVARGEFSIIIAGLGGSIESQLGPLAAAYVLFLAILGPALAGFVK
jgi:CPA2 family monovalent cation:H+ antiporter-2